MTYQDPFAVAAASPPSSEPLDAPTQFATPFTTMLMTSRVGIDPVTGNIWQYQNTRGMVQIGNVSLPPYNTAPPAITGSAVHGTALTLSNTGSWGGGGGTTTYQWYSGATALAGQTSTSYTTVAGDVGNLITCVVTTTNTGGVASATSNAIGPIT